MGLKKQKLKTMMLALGLTVVTSFSVVFAGELETLSIETATARAIRNSSAIRAAEDNIRNTREEEQRAIDIFFANPMIGSADIINFQTSMLVQETQRAVNNTNIASQRATLEFIVTNHFANITMAKNELDMFEENLRLMQRDMQIMEVRFSLGLASAADVQSLRNNLEVSLNNKVNLENAIESSFRELNRLMGSSTNDRYEIELDLEFELLGEIDLARLTRASVDNDTRVASQRANRDVTRFQLDNRMLHSNPMTGEVIPGQPTRAQVEINAQQAQRGLNDSIQTVENSIVDLINQIRNLELVISSTELQLDVSRREHEIAKLNFETGNITQLDLERSAFGIVNLEETLRRHKTNHSIMVMQLMNPNIAA